MAAENKNIWVYADWVDTGGPMLMGNLTATHVRGKEIFSFEYANDWLNSDHASVIDPGLQLYGGTQYLTEDKPNFGVFLDSSPDRWRPCADEAKGGNTGKRAKRKASNIV